MEQAFAELPLAVFTTLAPIGAGAFIALALAFFTTKFTDEQQVSIDRLSFIPLALVAIGFGASFLHLASPLNAPHALAGIGVSPLSNEILVGIVFFVLALAYCIAALTGKLSTGARKVAIAIVAVAALVFAVFTGLAYSINTIVSWATPLTPLEIIGFCLLGGSLLGIAILAGAGALADATKTGFKMAMLVVLVIGAALAIGSLVAHVGMVSSLVNPVMSGAELAGEVTLYLVAFVVGAVIALACGCWALLKNGSAAPAVLGAVIALVAVFVARLVFYALQMSVGL